MVVVAVHLVGIGKCIRIGGMAISLLLLLMAPGIRLLLLVMMVMVLLLLLQLGTLQGVTLRRVRWLLVIEIVAAAVRMSGGAPAVVDVGAVAAVHGVGKPL